MVSYDDYLLLGTKEGHLLLYSVKEGEQGQQGKDEAATHTFLHLFPYFMMGGGNLD